MMHSKMFYLNDMRKDMTPDIILLEPVFRKESKDEESYFGFKNVLGEKLLYSLLFYKRKFSDSNTELIDVHLSTHGFMRIPLIKISQRKDLETEVCASYANMSCEQYFVLDTKSKKLELIEFAENSTNFQGKNYHTVEKNKLFSRMHGFHNRINKGIRMIDEIVEEYDKHAKHCKK